MTTLSVETQNLFKQYEIGVKVLDHKWLEVQHNGKTYARKYTTSSNFRYIFSWRGTTFQIADELPSKFQPIETEPEPTPPTPEGEAPKHEKHNLIKNCIEQDIPVFLVGDGGTGKNYTLQQIAKEMDLTFYFTNSVQQEFKITGFIDAGGNYHETEFYKAFKDGGLFFLDEMDASIPEVLILLNAAIANRYFEFPNGRIEAHENFRVVAAGNTCGTGRNEMYSSRFVLDGATLDRFVVIEFDYSNAIELHLANYDTALVNYIRALRDKCRREGINALFSYRAIIHFKKLQQAKIPTHQIKDIVIFKGLDRDTRTLLESSCQYS